MVAFMQTQNERKPTQKTPKVYKRLSEGYLRNAGLYYLQRHAASCAHFIEVMDRKIKRSLSSHPDQDVEAFREFITQSLVPDFVRLGYLNDALYTQGLVNSLCRKGLPNAEIRRRVRAKGVDGEVIDEHGLLEEHDDLAAAVRMMQRKRLGVFATKERELQKDMAALARYGFSYHITKTALELSAEDAKALLMQT